MKIHRNISFYLISLFALLAISCSSKQQKIAKQEIDLNAGWEFKQSSKEKWYPATVPGTVHTDLYANDLIPDPFYRQNEKDLQWIENEAWEYKKTFDAPAIKNKDFNFSLQFDGLDTYADVFLNDKKILSADNMFVGYESEVTSLLKEKGNELRILFHSPIKKTEGLRQKAGFEYPAGNDASEEKLSVYARKAPYHYGWDWGPRFVTSGIWRDVKLVQRKTATIKDLHIIQESLDEQKAELAIELEIEAFKAIDDAQVQLLIGEKNVNSSQKISLKEGLNQLKFKAQIDTPQLWWPNGLGEQHRYEISARLFQADEQLDENVQKIGLRTIEVVNEPDSIGESFYVKVNGQPVFMKGVNYIPQDSFLPSVTKERYDWMFESMIDANMNMVRVWGGGIYEDDYFYELCDEKGLLLWQDFMFACTMYPGDEDFLKKVEEEAIYNIKRIRNRPSLALWCGNNEIQVGWENWGWQTEFKWSEGVQQKLISDYNKLFKELLPNLVKTHDANRFYYPSSPISNWGNLDDFKIGDNHYWGVWWGKKEFESFKEYVPRFMSEFGFQSFPAMESIKAFSEAEDWDLNSDVMNQHQKSSIGNVTIKEYMQRDYEVPSDFQDFVYVGQLLQAEGMKLGLEVHRRRMPYCMGTLYWQLNDCWPAASWSSIDYYGKWKALHYAVREAFSTQLVSTDLEGDRLKVFLVNDEWQTKDAQLQITWNDFKGNILMKKISELKLAANSSEIVIDKHLTEVLGKSVSPTERQNSYLKFALVIDGKEVSKTFTFLTKPKNQQLPTVKVATSIIEKDGELYVKLATDAFTTGVEISFDGQKEIHLSDNYFYLEANEEKLVKISRTSLDKEDLSKIMKVKCLNNI
ncbi:beta-mannosidase [Sediminitomix flava]|uniref:Beta-mannosidase B n=1 Tax=Sediminitomix flava TaxID=379075 RepID=A0A315Z9K4_SEDFL|nr:glycoside hydrolase family 2 protein [Sediminitomix flava]PWJ42191.1 beta-mannosidase [Sediminitomix flava]